MTNYGIIFADVSLREYDDPRKKGSSRTSSLSTGEFQEKGHGNR